MRSHEIPNLAIMSPTGPMLLESVQFVVFQGVPMIDIIFSGPSGIFRSLWDQQGVTFLSSPAEGSFHTNTNRS